MRNEIASALGDLADDEVAELAGKVCQLRNDYAGKPGRMAPVWALMFGDFAALVAADRDRRRVDRLAFESAMNPVQVVGVELPER